MTSEEFYQISRTYKFVFTFEYVNDSTTSSVNIYCNNSYMGVWNQEHGLSLTNERTVIQDGLNTEERMQLIRHIAKFVLGVAMERKMIKCRYSDCKENYPVASDDEQVSCKVCRETLGLD